MQDSAIGIFDSGIGGLTVFQEIAKILPEENLVYLGDTAHVPYGTKSAAAVTRYSLRNVVFLLQQRVKAVVVACNTASALALKELKKEFALPILGVINPGAQGALRVSRIKKIGVIGTEGTIKSGAYSEAIRLQDPKAQVTSIACPLFVPLVEEGWLEGDVVERVSQKYLHPLLQNKIDVLILGCTHYPLLKRSLQKVVGPEVSLIDSAEETANEIAQLLTEENLIRKENKNPRREYFVTDSPERFQRVGELFLGHPLKDVRQIEIEM